MNLPPYDLTDCVDRILRFRDARNWRRFHSPKDLSAALAIEASEVQELFLWQPTRGGDELRRDEDLVARAGDELADCAIYLLLTAHELGIDLAQSVRDKLDRNESRFPAPERG